MAYEFNHYYELQNVATGKYVNVLGNHEDGTVKNGEAVNLFNRTNNKVGYQIYPGLQG